MVAALGVGSISSKIERLTDSLASLAWAAAAAAASAAPSAVSGTGGSGVDVVVAPVLCSAAAAAASRVRSASAAAARASAEEPLSAAFSARWAAETEAADKSATVLEPAKSYDFVGRTRRTHPRLIRMVATTIGE